MGRFSRRSFAILLAIVASVAVVASTAQGGNTSKKASVQVAVLLPDTQSSVRWETADRPFLSAAFKKAGLTYSIVNAQGSAQTQQTQAEQAITNGAKVMLLVDLDSGSGAAIEKNAKAHGVQVIDYDRLTLKGGGDVLRVVRQRPGRARSRARASSAASRRAACTARRRSSPS